MENFIRLKSSTDIKQIRNRLEYNPSILELQLFETDLHDIYLLQEKIFNLKSLGIKVFLHHPTTHKGKWINIMSKDKEILDYYWKSSSTINKLCETTNVKCVIHAHYPDELEISYAKTKNLKKSIEKFTESFNSKNFLWEDTSQGLFSYANPYLIEEIINPLRLDICLDTSHSFISLKGSNEKLKYVISVLSEYIQYFHVVDSHGLRHDSLELGHGKIQWENIVLDIIKKDFIFEVGLQDNNNCLEMLESSKYFINSIPLVTN